MWELIVNIGNLIWTIICSTFLLHKQLTGIQNDILAAAVGVSPILITFIIILVKRLIKFVKDS